MRLKRLKIAGFWRTFFASPRHFLLLRQNLIIIILLMIFILLTTTTSAQDDYATTGQDEFTTRCLDEQCDCDKLSSAVICSDSDFASIPNRQLVMLPFGVSRLTLTRNKFSINGELGAENFTGLGSQLEELVIQECGITKLRHGLFNGMPRLIYLDLSMNKLRKLAKRQFSMLPSLEVLVLSGNRALRLDHETFAGSSASELALDECGLTELPRTVTSFPVGLRRLYLQDNRLQTIAIGLKSLFEEFEDVRLRGNKWHCDSRISWLLDIFHRRRDAFSDDPVCESPDPMAGRRFSTVSSSEAAMKTIVTMPHLPPDSSEDDTSGPVDIYEMVRSSAVTTTSTSTTTTSTTTTSTTTTTTRRPTTTTTTTTTPRTTTTTTPTTTTTTTTTLRHLLRYSSTVVPLSRDINAKSHRVVGGGGGSSSEWQIDYPSAQDDLRAREYEEAYELRERTKNRGKAENFPPPDKPVAIVQPVDTSRGNDRPRLNNNNNNNDYDDKDDEFDTDGPALDEDDVDEAPIDDDVKSDERQIETPVRQQVLPTIGPTSRNGGSGKQRSGASASSSSSSNASPSSSPLRHNLNPFISVFLLVLLQRFLLSVASTSCEKQ